MSPEAAQPAGAKKLDYWWTVLFTDPLAVPLVRLLARRRWITPDAVSVVALFLGLGVGIAFSFGTRAALVAGGILFYLAFFVDCIDGKLARATGVTSHRGEGLDAVGDATRRASASLGLIVWVLRADDPPSGAIWWVVVYVVAAYYFFELSGGSELRLASWFKKDDPQGARAERGSRWSRALARRRLLPNPGMPDVQAVVFILGPITGLLVPALALGIAMVTAGMLVNIWRRVR